MHGTCPKCGKPPEACSCGEVNTGYKINLVKVWEWFRNKRERKEKEDR